MDALTRHQCMIYGGSPARVLPALVATIRERLATRFRCMYFDSPAMVAGLRSLLYAAGTDVEQEIARGNLLLVADDTHLVAGRFDIDRMIGHLEGAVAQALADGYVGLFATGDMSWEFGPERDFSKLLEYEWRLEQVFAKQPALSGICQYHCDLLPAEALREGLISHASLFVNDTLARLNPHYVAARSFEDRTTSAGAWLDDAIAVLLLAQA